MMFNKKKIPKIVPLAKHEVSLVVELRADLPKAAVAAAALEAVLVPEALHGFEQEPLRDDLAALRAQPGPARVAHHAAVETVFVLILLTCSKENNL